MMRHPVFRIALLSAFFFLLGFTYNYHLPQIESFLLVEIERLSHKHSPVRVWAKRLHFHLLPLGVVLEDVKLLPTAPADRYLAPTVLKEAGARLAFWPLLRGELRLAQVFLRDSEITLFLRKDLFASTNAPKAAPMKFDFETIYRLPVDELLLERVRLQGRIEPQNLVFRADDINLLIENRYRSLFVELGAPDIQFKPSGPLRAMQAQAELRLLIEAQEMQVSALKLKADDSFVVASGHFNGDLVRGVIENGAFNSRTKLKLADVNLWEKAFLDKPLTPELKGEIELDLSMEVRDRKGYQVSGKIDAQSLSIGKYEVGTLRGPFASDLQRVSSEKLTLTSPAGQASVRQLSLDVNPPYAFSGRVVAEPVEIKQLLSQLRIRAPILIPIRGDMNCKGVIQPSPDLNCHGDVKAERVHVFVPRSKPTTIVDVYDLRGRGEVHVNDKEVTYKAELEGGKSSKGRSSGRIGYDDGFKIAYEADNLDFADVKNLSNLKLEGQVQLTGTTEGTSEWGTLQMNAEGKNLWLEDYPLGNLTARLQYKQDHLKFSNVQGQLGATQYRGDLDLDLGASRLKMAAQMPFADLHDIQSLFERKVKLPFDLSGTGQGQLEAEGPLNFRLLSYKLQSSFFRGEAARELFDEITFNVTSKEGFVVSDRVHLVKSQGVAELKGQITPEGAVDCVVVGRGLRLEQSENINNLGFDLQGLADFTMLIRGELPRPRVELNGRLSRVVMADLPTDDSVFKLNFLSDRLEGSGQFWGSTVLADLVFPFDNEAPFALKLKATKWDFTTLFSLVSRTARQLDFATSLSGTVNLSSPRGGFWESTGQIQIDEFLLRKGSKTMSAAKPMIMTMRQGEMNSNGFNVSSGDSYLKLDVSGLRKDRLNATLNGKMDLSLLGLFTPFIADLRGNMALSMDLSGHASEPKLSGSAYIEKGYAKFTDFIHPFSNVRADILFNDNQIMLNSVRSDMAGGKVSGEGRIRFERDSRPIDVRGSFHDVKINVPENFRTQGSGTVAIQGNDFPYTLAIDYTVMGGEVTFEPGEGSEAQTTVKPSPYLPRSSTQETFHPFTFAVDVNLKNPVLVNNQYARAQVSGRVSATGTPDRLLLNGTLTPLPGGKVFFRDRPFDISSAFFEYTNAPPQNPKVYLNANARISEVTQLSDLSASGGGSGGGAGASPQNTRTTEQQYDINLLVQGKGPVPPILLTSQPPLSQREIVSLLALGTTQVSSGGDFQRRSENVQAASSSAAVGAVILQKAGGKKIKEKLGVDLRVSSSQPTADNASQPTVTLSKQLTPKFSASASSTLQTNPANNVRLEYRLNNNVSAVGSWDGREVNRQQQGNAASRNVFGLDLEYKLQFK